MNISKIQQQINCKQRIIGNETVLDSHSTCYYSMFSTTKDLLIEKGVNIGKTDII